MLCYVAECRLVIELGIPDEMGLGLLGAYIVMMSRMCERENRKQ